MFCYIKLRVEIEKQLKAGRGECKDGNDDTQVWSLLKIVKTHF